MASCETQLWQLVGEIEPTATQKDGAKRSHNYLREILCTGNMGSRIKGHYLSGSYARDTAIRPLDDVDIIFVIDPSAWAVSLLASFLRPAPAKVLESFANAIRYRYPVSSVFGQRRSVRLELFHLDIDVVPAIEDDGDRDFVWIPDRDADDWIKSSPKRHSMNAIDVNRRSNERFKPLVKILKYWNGNLPSTASMKSFAIETMAVRIFQNVSIPSLQDGILLYFDFLSHFSSTGTAYTWSSNYGMSMDWLACSVPDAAGTGTNVVAGVDYERRSKFLEHATRSRNRMLDARSSSSVDAALKSVGNALRASL